MTKSRPLRTLPAGHGLGGTDLSPRQFKAIVVILLALITLSYLFLDRWLTDLLPELPRDVVLFHRQITNLGLGGPWLIGSLVLGLWYWWQAKQADTFCRRVCRRTRATACLFVFMAVALSGIITNVIKACVGRPRPSLYEKSALYFDFDPFPASAMWKSFPSGHTTTIFAAALAIGFFAPRWRWPLLALACIVGGSRVYIGAHYPSDVLGGIFIAYLTTYALRQQWEKKYRLPFSPAKSCQGQDSSDGRHNL